jgi:hypothetical protein
LLQRREDEGVYLFRQRPAESLIRMACSLRSTRLQGRIKKEAGGMMEVERKEEGGGRKGIKPRGVGRDKKGGEERGGERRRNGERPREELIWRGGELTVDRVGV